ncbi:phage tail sheath family protein [Chromobacterium violaceum]|uniref:Phage tail sheath n=1 Tax=Chromobacterium violaceum TaxID=536 RepID=A0A2R4K2N7_CHRVL|nr:phage tail sheath C-terminal domain-containing protein [Chromobacterium violaceum]AVV48145.1 phage tail sheath [Chromobacterium violaceum]
MASKPYTTPGVYVTEVSTLAPSVAQVATAIPAFIGYVQTALDDNGQAQDLSKGPVARRISSMLDYQKYFGLGEWLQGTVKQVSPGQFTYDRDSAALITNNYLYYAVQHFYLNGGGDAYVIAVGTNSATHLEADFIKGIDKARELDEVTLLLAPEAVSLPNYYQNIAQYMLTQAHDLGDRFALIDTVPAVDHATAAQNLRDKVTATLDTLKYGAAYYPYLNTTLTPALDPDPAKQTAQKKKITLSGVKDSGGNAVATLDLLSTGQAEYAQIMAFLALQSPVLPPSAAIAGVYAQTDGDRGVWKAPANVPLAAVSGPSVVVTADQQGKLNIDPVSGKSINAIRSFTGQGTLVWGARTLAGNSNEWRYINVRRLFNMVEESVKLASAFAVFEPNAPMTWLKVKSMIDTYLTNLWKEGALFGDTAEQAFYVAVGLGTTMTEDDINNGYMNIKIGLAAVRPAEFIELAFSHKSISA